MSVCTAHPLGPDVYRSGNSAWRHLFPTARICSSSGRETRGVGSTGTVGSSVTVGKACEPGQIARLVLHGFKLHSGLGAPAVQLLTAALLFCSVRGDSCLSEWGIHRPFSTPAPEKVCCGSSSSESSWRERQAEEAAGSRTFEAQALESIRGNVFSLIRAFQGREGFDRRELGSPLLWKAAQLERRERIIESPGRHWAPVCRRRAHDVNPRGRFSGKSAEAAV